MCIVKLESENAICLVVKSNGKNVVCINMCQLVCYILCDVQHIIQHMDVGIETFMYIAVIDKAYASASPRRSL